MIWDPLERKFCRSGRGRGRKGRAVWLGAHAASIALKHMPQEIQERAEIREYYLLSRDHLLSHDDVVLLTKALSCLARIGPDYIVKTKPHITAAQAEAVKEIEEDIRLASFLVGHLDRILKRRDDDGIKV